jgi:hypothetical protein
VTSLRGVTYVTYGSGYAMSDENGNVMAAGISAVALWYCLRDLTERVDALPPGKLRDSWVEAAGSMDKTLRDVMGAHRLTGDRW